MLNRIKIQFDLPVDIFIGSGEADLIGYAAKDLGSKALIVTGGSSAKKSGLYDRVKSSLNEEGKETVLFDKVRQNPLTTTAEEGAQFAKDNGCDFVVGVGGGSVMDCAKAIAFMAVNDGDINDYIFGRMHSDDALPLALIPTTCGTGSEGNGFAVLTNPETGDKKSLRCDAIYAKVALIEPECMMTMPKSVLASVGFDALCHNIEAYTAKNSQPFTDALSLYAITLTADNLVKVYEDPTYKEGWKKLAMASTIGGISIGKAGVTLAHGMEHPVSGLCDAVHGRGLAALAPVVIDASYKGNPKKFAEISKRLGGKDERDCAKAVSELLKKLDMKLSLSDLGIKREDIAWLAENCMKVSIASVANNPVVFTREKIAELYARAL